MGDPVREGHLKEAGQAALVSVSDNFQQNEYISTKTDLASLEKESMRINLSTDLESYLQTNRKKINELSSYITRYTVHLSDFQHTINLQFDDTVESALLALARKLTTMLRKIARLIIHLQQDSPTDPSIQALVTEFKNLNSRLLSINRRMHAIRMPTEIAVELNKTANALANMQSTLLEVV